jgi:hypothetical protein
VLRRGDVLSTRGRSTWTSALLRVLSLCLAEPADVTRASSCVLTGREWRAGVGLASPAAVVPSAPATATAAMPLASGATELSPQRQGRSWPGPLDTSEPIATPRRPE